MNTDGSALDDNLLETFINGFYGYGNLNAPHWFIGMEEGGGDNPDEIRQRLTIWRGRGGNVIEDLAEYHRAIGVTRFFELGAKLQRTWSKLIRVLHVLEGKPVLVDALRHSQREAFGRHGGTSCLAELLPLPSPSTNRWLYSQYSTLEYLKDRETYRQTVLPGRVAKLSEMIGQYQPRTVLFYGVGYLEYWRAISGRDFTEVMIGAVKVWLGRSRDTLYAVTPHPTARGITNAYFDRVGELIRDG